METNDWSSQLEPAELDEEEPGTFPAPDPARSTPLLSIGDVSTITGISEATLRVWQRRYSFPEALRSAGGHRLYREQDVLRLLWVKLQMDSGMRARRAIFAQQTLTQEAAILAALQEPLPHLPPDDPGVVALQPTLLQSLLDFESARATSILADAAAQSSVSSVVANLVGPTLAAIGEAWSQGAAEVATEHFATNLLRQQMILWMRASPLPFSVRPVALACAPAELHEGGLLMLAVLLRQRRWPITYLGQLFPLSDIPALVEQVQPALIVFAAMTEAAAQELTHLPEWLAHEGETGSAMQLPLIGYGGRAFVENPALAEGIPGTLLGATLYEASQRIHRLLLHLYVLPAAQPADLAVSETTS